MTGAGNQNQSVAVNEIVAFLSQLKSGVLTGQLHHTTGDEALKPIIDAVNGLARHLHDQAKAQDQAHSDAADVRFIVDSLGIGIWKCNLETNEVDWDKNMYRLYGCGRIFAAPMMPGRVRCPQRQERKPLKNLTSR